MELMEIGCHSYPSDAIFLHSQAFVGILVESVDGIYVMKKTDDTRKEQGCLSLLRSADRVFRYNSFK